MGLKTSHAKILFCITNVTTYIILKIKCKILYGALKTILKTITLIKKCNIQNFESSLQGEINCYEF
jgi:hypothetical protein